MTVTQHEKPELKRLLVKYGRVSMNMEMSGQKYGYDSDQPGGPDPPGWGKCWA